VSVRVWKQVVCVCNIVASEARSTSYVPHHNCQGSVCTKCRRLCPCPPLPLIHTVGMHSFDAECRWLAVEFTVCVSAVHVCVLR
jgi:hypothetical protein